MSKSQVTIAEAAFLTGKARQTINKFTKRGDLSFSRNQEGAKVIEIAELQRVLPLIKTMEDLEKARLAGEGVSPVSTKPGSEESAVLKVQLQAAERERDMVMAERERERRQLQDRIENLESSLASSQEQSKALLQLTDQSAGRPQASEEQARMNRELNDTVKRLERQVRKMQVEQEAKSKGFFSRWLGGGQSPAQRPAAPQTAKA